MNSQTNCFETKVIAGTSFYDSWGLSKYPLYICPDKKGKPHVIVDEDDFEGAYELNSLTDLRDFFYKNDWMFENRYWPAICSHIQSTLNIPYNAH